MSIILKSPNEVTKEIAKRVQEKRLSYNWSQNTLASRSGVSYGTLKKFERTGQISLESLLKIALVLDSIKKFDLLFKEDDDHLPNSLDELLSEDKTRKRGRK